MESSEMLSNQGKVLKVLNGFKYSQATQSKRGVVWKCTVNSCNAHLLMDVGGSEILELLDFHSHDASGTKIEHQQLANSLKRKAASDLTGKPLKIIKDELSSVTSEVAECINKKDIIAIWKSLNRASKSALAAAQQNTPELKDPEGNPPEQNIVREPVNMETSEMLSNKGKVLKVLNGFKYRWSRQSKKGVKWSCPVKGCKARLLMDVSGSKILELLESHSHEPIGTKLVRQQLANSLKRKAASDLTDKPLKIIKDELFSVPSEIAKCINKKDIIAVRKSLNRARKSALAAAKKNTPEINDPERNTPEQNIVHEPVNMETSEMFSNQGKVLKVLNGFKYRRRRQSKRGVAWSCPVKGCKARLLMDVSGSKILELLESHSHEPIGTKIVRQQLANSLKRKASSDLTDKPLKIIKDELSSVPSEIANCINKKDIYAVRKSLYRARRSALAAAKKNAPELNAPERNTPEQKILREPVNMKTSEMFSNKGKVLKVLNGFKYRLRRQSKRGFEWSCPVKGCKARMLMDVSDSKILELLESHSHEPIGTKIVRQQLANSLKKKAASASNLIGKPLKVIKDEISSVPSEIAKCINKKDIISVRKSLYRARKKSALAAAQQNTPELNSPELNTPELYTPELYNPELYTPELKAFELYTPELKTFEQYTPELNTLDLYTPELYLPEQNTQEQNTPEENIQEQNTPEDNTQEQYTSEQNTQEQNTSEQNTQEQNTPEQNTQEQNTPEDNTQEQNTSEQKKQGRKSDEQSIASARASVMVYDDVAKKWIPSGSSSGLSKVHIFQHQINNSFRVVGRKLQDHEVVINCAIIKGLKYNQATNTFHQWRDNKQVYGLNFSNKEDADNFARAMVHVLDVLSNAISRPAAPPPPPQPAPAPVVQPITTIYQQTNGQYEEEATYSTGSIGSARGLYHQVSPGGPQRIDLSPSTHTHSRTMTREDAAQIQERRMSQQNQMISSPNASSPQGPPVPPTPTGQGHHRTSSAPPAPQPPPMSLAAPLTSPPPPVPPAPPCPPLPWSAAPSPAASGPPPPPPPPAPNMSRSSSSDGPDQCSLAAQLQSARLRRSNKQSAENSGSSTSSSGSNYGTLGRGQTGMASMMDEMAKTLARRRAAAEKKEPDIPSQDSDCGTGDRKGSMWGSAKLGNGCESSPKPTRKQLNSSNEELQSVSKVNGDQAGGVTSSELYTLKQEILQEIRKEINKAKLEIIDCIKVELSRR